MPINNYLRRLPKEKAPVGTLSQKEASVCCAICDWVRGGDRWCWILITSDQQLTRKLSLSGAQIPVAATARCSVDMRGHSDGTQVFLWHCASVWIICGYKN